MDLSLISNEEHRETLRTMLPMDDGGFKGVVLNTDSLVKGFSVTIRLNVETKEEALRWLDCFQEKSKLTFRVERTHPENTQKIVFKKEYHCIHNTKPKRNSLPHEKHLKCNAKLTLTVKNKGMKRSKDTLLNRFPCEVLLRHSHSHPIYSSSALKFRPPNVKLEEKFKLLFGKGHSPSTALSIFKDELFEEHGNKYHEVVADGSKCPTQKWVYDLYYQVFKKEYGEPTGEEMIQSMEKAIKQYNDKCGSVCAAIESSNNVVISICSPIMKRVHTFIRASGEIMFVDSSGNMDRHNTRLFLLLCPSVVGALPLGIIMTYSESEEAITSGIKLLQHILPETSFYEQKYPKIIVTDDCDAERNSLKECFKDSSLILCKFHMLQSVMRFLWNSNNEVHKNNRVEIFQLFRHSLNCATEQEFLQSFDILISNSFVANNNRLKKYFINLKSRATIWAMCYRSHLLTRGNETNNYSEASFRILKDKILLRKKAFSIVQLFDYLITNFEEYYIKKITDIINGRWEGSKQRNKYYFKKEAISDLECTQLEENMYNVKSKENYYVVNSELETCTCFVGNKGAPCKHQLAVVNKFNLHSQQFHPTLIKSDFKNIMHKVIYGVNCKIEGWYLNLDENGNRDEVQNPKQGISSNLDKLNVSGALAEVATSHQIIEKNPNAIRKELEGFVNLLMNKYENNFDEYNRPISKFLENVTSCKTDSSLISALHTFGKYNGGGMPKIRSGKNLQGGNNIGVQPTAIMRRKTQLGGRNLAQSGRPPKSLRLSDHAYSKVKVKSKKRDNFEISKAKNKTAAPHSLTYCVTHNISLGKTHSKK